jgi:hypothetical protein
VQVLRRSRPLLYQGIHPLHEQKDRPTLRGEREVGATGHGATGCAFITRHSWAASAKSSSWRRITCRGSTVTDRSRGCEDFERCGVKMLTSRCGRQCERVLNPAIATRPSLRRDRRSDTRGAEQCGAPVLSPLTQLTQLTHATHPPTATNALGVPMAGLL